MSNSKIAVQFSNCLGNFIIMTSALKVLRQNYNEIDLITDECTLINHPAVKILAEEFFNDVKMKKPSENEYDKIYTAAWSRPSWTSKVSCDWRVGVSEVQIYLNMIQKGKDDFKGFLTKIADQPILEGSRPRIALANSSKTRGCRMGRLTGWDKFPQLSKTLLDLGFDVILVGQGDELKDCKGQSFIDKLDILETGKVISQCDLMVCVDTGLMHLADSLAIPIVVLAGPGFLTKSRPALSKYKVVRKFISCAPCYQTNLWNLCNDPQCMRMIQVDDVLSKIFAFNLRTACYKKPDISANYTTSNKEKVKIVIPYYEDCERVEQAKRTWLYPEVVFAIMDSNVTIKEESFYEPASSEDLGFKTRKKPLLMSIMKTFFNRYPDEDYYGYFNSDIILPAGKNVRQLLPSDGKVAALHHRLDLFPDNKQSRYVGKDGFIMTRQVMIDFLAEFPQVILGAAGWDAGLFFWLCTKYGEDNIDFCFDEILHVAHTQGWDNADEDTFFNRSQIKTSAFPVDWDAFGKRYADLPRRQNKRDIIGLIQPRRLGDIFIVLPIAHWYFDKGFEVWWPICSEWMYLQHYVNYVKFIDIGKHDGCYERACKYLNEKADQVIDLGIGIGRNLEWTIPFDAWKYQEADVPFEERQKLQINRDYTEEAKLKTALNLKDPYNVTHSKGSNRHYDFQLSDAIEVRPVGDHPLLDWIGILEDAKKVFCLDSCVSNLVDGLGIVKDNRFIKFNDNLRDGANVVRLSEDWQNVEKLPVHFFTIVWNGMPFIKYHLSFFEQLSFDWHWHIVEGPAGHGQDSGSQGHHRRGGILPDVIDDGTINYLTELSKHPNITVYPRNNWQGKVDMIKAPLRNIDKPCVLWQIDSDEFYGVKKLEKIYRIFMMRQDKNVAALGMIHFVGPHKYVVKHANLAESLAPLDTWGNDKCSRLWRYKPGLTWLSHAPPVLSFEKQKKFIIDEKFYHYAYVCEQQIKFKGLYYGYGDFLANWKRLQTIDGKVRLNTFFPWLKGTHVVADDWLKEHPIPVRETEAYV